MKSAKRINFAVRLAVLAVSASLVAGCGQKSADDMLKSAREFIDKKDYAAASIQLKNVLQQKENGEARFLLARVSLENGEFPFAELHLRKALEDKYPAEPVYPLLASALISQGKFKAVVDELANVRVADAKQSAAIKNALGEAYLGQRQLAEAKAAFAAAQAAAPGDLRARVGEARILLAEGKADEAEKVADEVLGKNPAQAEALALKADLLSLAGKNQAAAEQLKALIKASPFNGEARAALISSYLNEKNYDMAAAAIEEMKKAMPGDIRRHYFAAVLAFRKNDAKTARESINQVLKVAPDHAPSLLLGGAIELALGSNSTAEGYLQKVLARFPNTVHARSMMATSLLRRGRAEEAETVLAPALRLAPEDAELLRTAGDVAFANRKLTDAANFYDRAMAREKDNALLKTRRAQVRMAAGDIEHGIEDLASASQLDPNQFLADLSLITALMRQKSYDKALAAVATLEKKQPNNPVTYNVKGTVLRAKQDNAQARASFEKALTLQFNYLPAATALAEMDMADKNAAAARKRFDLILEKEPKNEGALYALAQVLVVSKAADKEIREVSERAIAANPASASARVAFIRYLMQVRDVKGALNAAQTANAAIPNDPGILDMLGLTQIAAKEFNQAVDTFNRLVDVTPKSPVPLIRVAMAQRAGDRPDAAIQTLRKVLTMYPEQLEAHREIVAILLATNRADDALKEARTVAKLRAKDGFGSLLEGDILASQGKLAEAAKAYADGVKRSPDNPLLLNNLAWTLGEIKDPGALAVAEKAYAKAPGSPEILDTYGWLLYTSGNAKRAAELLTLAAKARPNASEVRLHQAKALLKAGDKAAAKEALEAATKGEGKPAVKTEAEQMLRTL